MGRKQRGRSVRESRKNQVVNQEENYSKAPHSFVFHRGHVGKNIKVLEMDLRKLMEPYTARKLQVRKKNVLKDFVTVGSALNISHFLILSKTDMSTNLKTARVPKGPTLTFKVLEYCLSKDILSSLKKNSMNPVIFNDPPLLVMNNFSGEGLHLKLMSSMFQNMFPSISVNQVKIDRIKRCVMLNYDKEKKTITLRQYMITVKPVGLSKPVKKLIKSKLPDLGKYADLDEYMFQGNLSESEGELDGPHNEVTLSQSVSSRGNLRSTQSAIRLMEVGPRLTLQLVKIEEGLCTGDVMYHEFVEKTPQDLANIKALREKKQKIRQLRKKEQSDNVQKKVDAKEAHKQKSLDGMKAAGETTEAKQNKDSSSDDDYDDDVNVNDDEDDDAEYYRQEVGVEPDKDLGLSRGMKRRAPSQSQRPFKKRRSFSQDKSKQFDKPDRSSKVFKRKQTDNNERFNKGSKKPFNRDNRDNNERFNKGSKKPFNRDNNERFNKGSKKPFSRDSRKTDSRKETKRPFKKQTTTGRAKFKTKARRH